MAVIAKIDGIPIPNVKSQEMTPEVLIDESRTASNMLKRDFSGVKRSWKLSAVALTPAEVSAILTLLADKLYGAVAFWLDEFGAETNTIWAYVTVEPVKRHPFGKNGVWYSNGADLELTVVEQ